MRQPKPSLFTYSSWRHGGWYVHDVRYPSGACGCVSRNYADHKWRIVCDPRPFEEQPTFRTRNEAAAAELAMVEAYARTPAGIAEAAEEAQREADIIARNEDHRKTQA